MKTTELAICDWISPWSRVVALYAGQVETVDHGFHRLRKDSQVSPLEIKAEMFHLNGFSEHKDLDGVATYLNEADDYLVELQAYKERDRWRFRIQRGPEAVVSIKARYVHELQHAMRLMGLHDMANNFKVKEGVEQ